MVRLVQVEGKVKVIQKVNIAVRYRGVSLSMCRLEVDGSQQQKL